MLRALKPPKLFDACRLFLLKLQILRGLAGCVTFTDIIGRLPPQWQAIADILLTACCLERQAIFLLITCRLDRQVSPAGSIER
jgi:hypothetical protein